MKKKRKEKASVWGKKKNSSFHFIFSNKCQFFKGWTLLLYSYCKVYHKLHLKRHNHKLIQTVSVFIFLSGKKKLESKTSKTTSLFGEVRVDSNKSQTLVLCAASTFSINRHQPQQLIVTQTPEHQPDRIITKIGERPPWNDPPPVFWSPLDVARMQDAQRGAGGAHCASAAQRYTSNE